MNKYFGNTLNKPRQNKNNINYVNYKKIITNKNQKIPLK